MTIDFASKKAMVVPLLACVLAFAPTITIAADLQITVTDPATGKPISEYEKSYTPEERAHIEENERISEGERSMQSTEPRDTQTGCEVATYNQYVINKGGGTIVGVPAQVIPDSGGLVTKGTIVGNRETCVDLTIINHDRDAITITPKSITAVLERNLASVNPYRGFSITIEPRGTYSGSICFGINLPKIWKIECRP